MEREHAEKPRTEPGPINSETEEADEMPRVNTGRTARDTDEEE